MNKSLTKLIFTLFSFSTLLSCTGPNNEEWSQASSSIPVVAGKYIVNDSRTEYRIVIPDYPNTNEFNASQELASYIKKSTGCSMQIIKESQLVGRAKYISLGNTNLFASAFAEDDMSPLDDKISAYFISTRDDNIYIHSNPNERGEGTIYGTYDFMHEIVNYEYYAQDEIYYTKETTINLRNYKDIFVEPSFDGRSISNYHLVNGQSICDHHRISNLYRGSEWASAIFGHSQVTAFVRPQDTIDGVPLYECHQDWFANKSAKVAETTNNQLCWTAGEGLEDYVAKRFIHYFQEFPDATYFMFGQEDNGLYFCNCERCQRALAATPGMNYAGLQIMFMNHVIEKTEAWIAENQPGRNVRYVVYAYMATKEPPVKDVDGVATPIDPKVIPNEKLYIFYAPIGCNFAFPLDNNYYNSESYLELTQWSQLAAGHLIIYLYDTNFRFYFANFGNFNTVQEMYKVCYDKGVTYIYTQGGVDGDPVPFAYLRDYVESRLMWNINLNYEELAKDFIDHYYKEASEEIYEYYTTVRERLTRYHDLYNDGGGIYTTIVKKEIYPYSVLRHFIGLFKKAMEKIAPFEESDPTYYSTMKARLMREYLSVIYITISLSRAELTDEEKLEMKEIFVYYTAYFGITKTSEGGTMIDVDSFFGV